MDNRRWASYATARQLLAVSGLCRSGKPVRPGGAALSTSRAGGRDQELRAGRLRLEGGQEGSSRHRAEGSKKERWKRSPLPPVARYIHTHVYISTLEPARRRLTGTPVHPSVAACRCERTGRNQSSCSDRVQARIA